MRKKEKGQEGKGREELTTISSEVRSSLFSFLFVLCNQFGFALFQSIDIALLSYGISISFLSLSFPCKTKRKEQKKRKHTTYKETMCIGYTIQTSIKREKGPQTSV
jgi:hypothetical protein